MRRLALTLGAIALCLAQPATLRTTLARLSARLAGASRPETPELALARGERALFDWVRRSTPDPGQPPGYGILAQWDLGHALVWAGGRPAVATNFGAYLGLDSYLEPWRFFLEHSESAALQRLDQRQVRYVVVTSRFRRNLESMVRVLHPGEVEPWLVGDERRAPYWLEGMGARLLAQMGGPLPDLDPRFAMEAGLGSPAEDSLATGLGSLRLVYLSPDRHRDFERTGAFGAAPIGGVFERVAGARVHARGDVGDVLRATLSLRYPGVERERVWRGSAFVGSAGLAELRVPYSSDGTGGVRGVPGVEAEVVGGLRWSLGARRGELEVPEDAVRSGAIVVVP